MRCTNCHYPLANLTVPRCPECGTPFDPRDPTTFISDEERNWQPLAVRFLLLWLVILAVGAMFGALGDAWKLGYLGLAAVAAILGFVFLSWRQRHDR